MKKGKIFSTDVILLLAASFFYMAFGPIIGGLLYGNVPVKLYYPILMISVPLCLVLYFGSRAIIEKKRA